MDDEPLIQRAAIAMLALVLLGASVNKPASAKEVPKLPNPTQTATASPMPTSAPTPTASPAPTSTPTATQTPTPDPNDVVYWTTKWSVERVMLWEPYAKMIIEQYEYDLDLVLVLSVMAAESGGDPTVVSYAGAVGLMQIIPKPHLYNIDPAGGSWSNMVLGMRILQGAIGMAEDRDLPFEFAIAFYNCSEKGVMTDKCGSQGGLNYADQVLHHWLPLFEERLAIDVSK